MYQLLLFQHLSVPFTVFNETKFTPAVAETLFNLLLFHIDYTQASHFLDLIALHFSGVCYLYTILT